MNKYDNLSMERGAKAFYTLAVCIVAFFMTAIILYAVNFDFAGVIDYFGQNPGVSLSIFGVCLCLMIVLTAFMWQTNKKYLMRKRYFVITTTSIVFVLAVSVVLMRFVPNGISMTPLLFSVWLVAILLEKRIAAFVSGFITIMMVTLLLCKSPNFSLDLQDIGMQAVITYAFSGILVALQIEKVNTRVAIVKLGAVVALASAPIAFCATFVSGGGLSGALLTALYSICGNVISVLLFSLFLPVFELVFKVCTDFRLAEYCSFNYPLLTRLAQEAPGTFNHSLVVASLAENCAIAIGENGMLARTAAYYHDVGKLKNPEFFIENQKGANPHDELIPEISVKKIINHTEYGAELLKEYKMPDEIIDVAIEHHGTTVTRYFYNKAQIITEGKARIEDYSYPGPAPRNKISAIVMICDSAEAAVRAMSKDAEYDVIASVVEDKIKQKQFVDCPITLKELNIIKETITRVLAGIYHKRISYKDNLIK